MTSDAGGLPAWSAGAEEGPDHAARRARPAGLRRRRRERTTAVLVLTAVVAGLVVFVTVVPPLVGAPPPMQPVPVPATLSAECTVGNYSVFERVRPDGASGVPAGGVNVVGPDGVPVEVRAPARGAALERADGRWVAVADFPAIRAGSYDVKVAGDATVVAVERTDADALTIPWLLVVPAVLVLVGSLVAIVVLAVRGRRPAAPAA